MFLKFFMLDKLWNIFKSGRNSHQILLQILQIVRGETIEFENAIHTKNNAKIRSLLSRGRGINPSYIGKHFT